MRCDASVVLGKWFWDTECHVPKPDDFICFRIISLLDTKLSTMSKRTNERKIERQENLISNENRMIGVLFWTWTNTIFLFVCMRTHLTHLTTEIKWIKQHFESLRRCTKLIRRYTQSHTIYIVYYVYATHHLYIRNGNASIQAIIHRIYIFALSFFNIHMHRGTVWLYAYNASSTAQCYIAACICAMCCFWVWKCFLNQNDIIRSPNVLWYYPI